MEPVSEFVRAAVAEKADRDLARLDQRVAAYDALHVAHLALTEVTEALTRGTAPVAAVAHDASAIARFKKLRKAVEDAQALSTELVAQLGVTEGLSMAKNEKSAIVDELAAVGVVLPVAVSSAASVAKADESHETLTSARDVA